MESDLSAFSTIPYPVKIMRVEAILHRFLSSKKSKKRADIQGIYPMQICSKNTLCRNNTASVYSECNGNLAGIVPSTKAEFIGVALGNLKGDSLGKVSTRIITGVGTVLIKLKDVAPRICARPGDGKGT